MDDFCKERKVFLTNSDKVNYTVTKSKSHFGLFKKTVNNAFKHVKERPEVWGLDTFLEPIQSEGALSKKQESTKQLTVEQDK